MKKRADGRYQARVYIGIVDGVKKYKSVFGRTQKEVNEKANELRTKLNRGIDILSENDTFGKWIDKWLLYKANLLSSTQYEFYKRKTNYFSNINHIKLCKVQISDLQNVINDLSIKNPITGYPTAKKTLRDIRMTAQQIFEFAIMNRAIDFNPAKYIDIPKNAPKQERRALTLEEQKWVFEFKHRAQLPAMIMMLSGLRLG